LSFLVKIIGQFGVKWGPADIFVLGRLMSVADIRAYNESFNLKHLEGRPAYLLVLAEYLARVIPRQKESPIRFR